MVFARPEVLDRFRIRDGVANPGEFGVTPKLTPTDSSGAPPPLNSEIRKIAEDVLGAVQYSYAAMAANPNAPTRPDSLESLFKQALNSMPADKRERSRTLATQMVQAPESFRVQTFGRAGVRSAEDHLGAAGGVDRFDDGLAPLIIDRKLLGIRTPSLNLDPRSVRSTAEGLLIPRSELPANFENFQADFESADHRADQSEVMDAEKLEDIWGFTTGFDFREGGVEVFNNGTEADDFEAVAVTDKMYFYVTRVKCVDETNPEWWGSDEIALAGVTVDEDGDTKKINEQYIGGGFDDGDSKNYSPHWRYTWFNMREGTRWPKTYAVTLILAEKDNGGLSSVLNTVWTKISEKVKSMIANAVTKLLETKLGPAIANIIGQAVAWVVDRLVSWIINAFKDDIFPPYIAKVTTPSLNARWYYPNGTWGNPRSPTRSAHFYGFGGHYYVQYYWKFVA